MKRVKYTGNVPEYCDGFPKDCERSCKGSIHLLPNALREITDGEYEFIKNKYPKMRLMVVPKEKPSIKKMEVPKMSMAMPKVDKRATEERFAKKHKKHKKN